jgi:hypothetical protein
VKDKTKTQAKEYVDLARLITLAMKEKLKNLLMDKT